MVESQSSRSTQLRDRILLGTLYVGFFCLVFVAALYWTFPYDRLKDTIAARLSSPEATGGTTVEIGGLEPSGISGVHISELSFTHAAITPTDPPNVLHLSEVTANVSLLGLLLGNQHVVLHATAGAGTLEGTVERNAESREVNLEFSALDVGTMGLGSWLALPLKGQLSGKIDLHIPNEFTKMTGNIELNGRGIRIGDGKTKLKPPGMAGNGFTLDEIDAGKLELALDVKDAVASLTKCSADGKDLKLGGKGSVRLADPWKRSRPDLNLDLTFTPAYKNRSDRTKAMFELLGMQPDWQRAITPDGAMHLHVGGTFLAIRGTPGRPSGGS